MFCNFHYTVWLRPFRKKDSETGAIGDAPAVQTIEDRGTKDGGYLTAPRMTPLMTHFWEKR